MPNQLLRLVSLAIVLAPLALSAQTPAPATVTFDIMLTVPLDLKDLNPFTNRVDLSCSIQPTGSPAPTVAIKADNKPLSVVVNGAFKGNMTAQYTVTSAQALAPGQQWSYFCGIFLQLNENGDLRSVVPGHDKAELIASGSNNVSGTFTSP